MRVIGRCFLLQPLLQTILLLLLFASLVAHSVMASEPDKTPEDIQKKAVITKYPSVKLFKQNSGDAADKADFMETFFIMKPEMNGRIPVSKAPNKTGEPDGWLVKDSFIEWNTVQMIQLEPQSGRKLAKVFDTLQCAQLFAKEGISPSGCQELGSEPNAWADKGKKSENQRLLIPIFSKEGSGNNSSYQGGFIRVFEKGSSVKTVSETTATSSKSPIKSLGYDVVFAIDSTGSMSKYFTPTVETLQEFIKKTVHEFSGEESQKINTPLRMGVLFYRDRSDAESSKDPNCINSYVTQWRQELTEQIDSVINALKNENEGCGGDVPEAVLDALNRVITDTKWQDNSFRAIILVGDAPAHGIDSIEKNPMKLSIADINKQAEEKNIRFLTIKLGEDDVSTFKALAVEATPQNKGRYQSISTGEAEAFKQSLLSTITNEWKMLISTVRIAIDTESGETKVSASDRKGSFLSPEFLEKYKLSPYEALIIEARLPDTTDSSSALPDFLKGWLPEKIQDKLIASEYIFIDTSTLKVLTNILDNVAEAALIGDTEGADAFISTIQHTLASQLKVSSSEVFKSGETINDILRKANILPFKTTTLVFKPEEIQAWKESDYKRLNQILGDKVKYLRELQQNAAARRMFGDKPHLYVPRAYFP